MVDRTATRAVVFGALLATGCDEDVLASTQISSLQVVSMVAEPVEVRPREATALTVTIADPAETGADVAVWMCTPLDDTRTCLEALAGDNLQPIAVSTRDPDTHSTTVEVVPMPVEVSEVTEVISRGERFRGVLAFALACAPGVCPLFDDIEAGTVDPAVLADPDLLLQGLPIEGVSLGYRTLTISEMHSSRRLDNPVIAPRFTTPVRAGAGESVDLAFNVDGDFSDGWVYPLTTVGGFATEAVETGPETPVLTWVAPSTGRSDGHIYAVVDDGSGGQAVWFGEAEVR
jgi:hypothetical protein